MLCGPPANKCTLALERRPGRLPNAVRAPADFGARMTSTPTDKDDKSPERDPFTVAVRCHWCGHNGMSLWEEADGNRQLVSLDGFYERLARKEPFRIETIRNSCTKAQPI